LDAATEYSRRIDLLAQATNYYTLLLQKRDKDTILRHALAEAYHSLGWTYLHTKQWDEAWSSLAKARDLWEQLARQAPQVASYRHCLCKTYHCMGRIREARGQLAGALQAYEEARRLWEVLLAERPGGEMPWMVAENILGLSRVLAASGHQEESLARLGEAKPLLSQVTDAHIPGVLCWDRIVMAHSLLVEGYLGAGRKTMALEVRLKKVQVCQEGLRRWPTDPRCRSRFLEALSEWLEACSDAQKLFVTGEQRAQAGPLLERWVADPALDPGSRHDMARRLMNMAVAKRKNEALDDAVCLGELSVRMFEAMVRQEPYELRHRIGLSEAWYWLAKCYMDAKQPEKALDAGRQAIAEQQVVFDREPKVAEYRTLLSRRYDSQVHRLLLLGCLAEAETCFLAQAKLWHDNAEQLREAARDLVKLADAVGQGRNKLTPAEQAERQRYLEAGERVAKQAEAVEQGSREHRQP
jgi:tetratricopeptide (TPR) repeat protein